MSKSEPTASITIPAYSDFREAVEKGSVVVVEDRDGHHTRLRAREAFYFIPLKSTYSDGEIIQWSKLETATGKEYREAQERLAFIRLLADLSKCPTCGVYDCTQHGNPTSRDLINEAGGVRHERY